MDRECYLFVSCPFGGTEVFMKNLRTYVDSRSDFSSYWVEVPRPEPSTWRGVDKLFDNWSLRASMKTASDIRRLQRNGTKIQAAFFNHLTAISLLPFRKSIPSMLSLDITPVLLNRDSAWYRQEGFRTKGVTEYLSRTWTIRTYDAMRYLLPWSHFTEASLLNDYGIASDRVIVQPPGVDLALWTPSHPHVKERNRRFTVLFVGGDFVRKGGDTLLEVAAQEAFRDVEFHFVTSAFPGSAADNIHVHQGILPNSCALLDLYRMSDVFAFPTRADYTPNAMVEAFAMGLPVITTNVGGLGEMVHEGEDGFIVPTSSPELLANRIMQLKSNPALLQEFKRNARRHAEKDFDIVKIGARIVDLLREIGSERRLHVQG